MLIKNPFVLYVARFIGAFCILYYGTQGVIGLAAPGRYYSGFIHDYLNYPVLLRNSLLYGARFFLSLFGYDALVHHTFFISMVGGRGVRMVYSCLGIGLISFWTAFVYANKGNLTKKLVWITGGLMLIWLINITRVALLLLAINKKWPMPLHLDNHTWFNIAAYTAIFILVYFYHRSSKKYLKTSDG